MVRVFTTREDLASAVGADLGASDWVPITQERVDEFARATGDHQWIHVDPVKAADGPFGTTIAHGFLTASLVPVLNKQIFIIESRMGINYGLNKVRFPAPVRVGSSVRATAVIKEVNDLGDAVQVIVETTVHVSDSSKPAAVAETVVRYHF